VSTFEPSACAFQPCMERVYCDVHRWLAKRHDTKGYRHHKPDLDAKHMKNVAARLASLCHNSAQRTKYEALGDKISV